MRLLSDPERVLLERCRDSLKLEVDSGLPVNTAAQLVSDGMLELEVGENDHRSYLSLTAYGNCHLLERTSKRKPYSECIDLLLNEISKGNKKC